MWTQSVSFLWHKVRLGLLGLVAKCYLKAKHLLTMLNLKLKALWVRLKTPTKQSQDSGAGSKVYWERLDNILQALSPNKPLPPSQPNHPRKNPSKPQLATKQPKLEPSTKSSKTLKPTLKQSDKSKPIAKNLKKNP